MIPAVTPPPPTSFLRKAPAEKKLLHMHDSQYVRTYLLGRSSRVSSAKGRYGRREESKCIFQSHSRLTSCQENTVTTEKRSTPLWLCSFCPHWPMERGMSPRSARHRRSWFPLRQTHFLAGWRRSTSKRQFGQFWHISHCKQWDGCLNQWSYAEKELMEAYIYIYNFSISLQFVRELEPVQTIWCWLKWYRNKELVYFFRLFLKKNLFVLSQIQVVTNYCSLFDLGLTPPSTTIFGD